MECVEDSTLEQHLGGSLDPQVAADVQQHVASCEDCHRRLNALALTRARLSASSVETRADLTPGPGDALVLVRGKAVGRYIILEQLATGGMSEVYAAYDPQLDRKVALKLLRADLWHSFDETVGRSRLLREAQAMARLSHPNVIAVHDVGMFQDQIFIAMEFVEGKTLAAWLQEPRSWPEIRDAFLAAGEGLQAAHEAGIIHRDFKPQNVLVGSDGRVRVFDFGLARPLETRLSPDPALLAAALPELSRRKFEAHVTQVGAVLGTPGYMSPEQLEGKGTDGRTDQFSFCVALYEALYGTRPFGGETLGQIAAEVLAGRIAPPARDGDIPDWVNGIVVRGLSADPAQRYPSMKELLQALRGDRWRARRRAIRAAWVAALLLAAGGGYLGLSRDRARRCELEAKDFAGLWTPPRKEAIRAAFAKTGRPFAQDAWSGVEAALDAYARAWTTTRADVCLAEGSAVRSIALLALERQCLDQRHTDAQALIAVLSAADAQVVENAVKAATSLPEVQACVDVAELTRRQPPPLDAATQVKVNAVRARLAEAEALLSAGKYARGLEIVGAVAPTVSELRQPRTEIDTLLLLGKLQEYTGDFKAADQTFNEAAWTAEAAREDESRAKAWIELIVLTGNRLAQPEQALRWAGYARGAVERLGKPVRLEAELRNSLGTLALSQGKYQQATVEYREAVRLAELAFEAKRPLLANMLSNLGIALVRQGNLDEGVAVQQRALALRQRVLGPQHPDVATSENNLAVALERKGEMREALSHYQRAYDILVASLGADHERALQTHGNIGQLHLALGDPAHGLEICRQAAEGLEKKLGPAHPSVAFFRVCTGEALSQRGDFARAMEETRRALAIHEKVYGPDHPTSANALTVLGLAQLGLGQAEQARGTLQHALSLRQAHAEGNPTDVAYTQFALAKALWPQRAERVRARHLATEARDAFMASGEGRHRNVEEIDAWLAQRGP